MPLVHPLLLALGLSLLLTSCGGTVTQKVTPAPDDLRTAMEYDEPYRPQVHFSPPTQWMNDPNGMVYHEGEYHLFYQYYPDSNVWGPMHWGHAVSGDLVEWEHLPLALYPDSLGWIFSGSAVVDHGNTSGLGEIGKDPLVAIFTYHNDPLEKAGHDDFQYQGIAYSNDRGRSWTKYAGNPVIPNTAAIRDFRDPKVVWDAEREQWLMVFAAQDRVLFWRSDNLIDWERLSAFGQDIGGHGGVWECPDIFPLQIVETGETRWVLLVSINPGGPNGGSATQYFVGNFDGTAFTLDPTFAGEVRNSNAVWLDYGRDNYAGVSWANIPDTDGRRLFMGWMSNWAYARDVPTTVWRGAMTVPRTLSLHQTPEGYRVYSSPVEELTQLRREAQVFHGEHQLKNLSSGAFELELMYVLDDDVADTLGVELRNIAGETLQVGYDAQTKTFYTDRRGAGPNDFSDRFALAPHRAPRISNSDTLRLHLILDRASVEVFADGGATVLTDIVFPTEPFDRVVLIGEGEGTIYGLRSIWGSTR
ncbi:glycoside hydrolase family 32 protein [Neolewinella sp.]|uniref:glycoside hydrolase family 32 protein n=1 Tax=Neolewinella sp. TaxID=2993543 RepID=UPI003B519083